MVEVSETTAKFLQDKCTRRVPNSERREASDCYPVPKALATRTLQLDPFMRPEASLATRAADKQLAKMQTLLLDAIAPLTSLLEVHFKGKDIDQQGGNGADWECQCPYITPPCRERGLYVISIRPSFHSRRRHKFQGGSPTPLWHRVCQEGERYD